MAGSDNSLNCCWVNCRFRSFIIVLSSCLSMCCCVVIKTKVLVHKHGRLLFIAGFLWLGRLGERRVFVENLQCLLDNGIALVEIFVPSSFIKHVVNDSTVDVAFEERVALLYQDRKSTRLNS